MLGAGALFATAMAAFDYVGGIRGVGDIRDQVDDDGEVERREELKKVRRRPLSETLQQLGEGRGTLIIHGSMQLALTLTRNLRPWLRGEEAATIVGKVRHRRQGSPRGSLNTHIYFPTSSLHEIPDRKHLGYICVNIPSNN